jgi:hypothetical protein
MRMKQRRRKPEEMFIGEKRPVSFRIRVSTYTYLEGRAKKAKISLSELIEGAMEDYAEYLKSQR